MNAVCKPGKRLRNWHRKSGSYNPLKTFARDLAEFGAIEPEDDRAPIASRWIASKAAS